MSFMVQAKVRTAYPESRRNSDTCGPSRQRVHCGLETSNPNSPRSVKTASPLLAVTLSR